MIVFDKLWGVMREKNISQYKLINEYGISPAQITRLKRNENVKVSILNTLCNILDCDICDIIESYTYFLSRGRVKATRNACLSLLCYNLMILRICKEDL